MLSKIFKNPVYMGWIALATLLIIALYVVDDRKNPKKDFFGLLKLKAAPTA